MNTKLSVSKEDKRSQDVDGACQKKSRCGIFVGFFGMIVAGLLIAGAGYGYWQFMNQKTDVEEALAQLATQQQTLGQTLYALEQRQREQMVARKDKMHDFSERWEAAYLKWLLQSADTQLRSFASFSSGVMLLETAQNFWQQKPTKTSGDRRLLQALEEDLQHIKNYQEKRNEMWSKAFDKVRRLIYQVTDPKTNFSHKRDTSVAPAQLSELHWKARMKASLKKINDLIVIRHWKQPIQPILDESALLLLRQIFYAQLQQAELALMQGQLAFYTDALAAMKTLLSENLFFPNAPFQSLEIAVEQLQKQDPAPKPPALSALKVLGSLDFNQKDEMR